MFVPRHPGFWDHDDRGGDTQKPRSVFTVWTIIEQGFEIKVQGVNSIGKQLRRGLSFVRAEVAEIPLI